MLWAALITGIIGSLHCTGMCGPLLCAMPINKKNGITESFSLILYNTGRIVAYAMLGILVGTGGAIISSIVGAWFSYLAGAILIGIGLFQLIRKRNSEIKMPAFMKKWMGKLFRTRSLYALPLLGFLNGLIPCGAVYAALAGASALASPSMSALYMLIFGLATWPAIFSSYYVSGKIIRFFKGYYKPATAIFLMLIGFFLISKTFIAHTRASDKPNAITHCQ